MNWFKLILSEEQASKDAASDIAHIFEQKYKRSRKPTDMALFIRDINTKSPKLYFSPSCVKYAKDILESYNAKSCEKPTGLSITELISGDFPHSQLD